MAEIVVLDSDSRRIDLETFRSNLGGFSADRIALGRGNIDATIDCDIDLSSYRGIYVRVGEITEDVFGRTDSLEIVSTCGSGYDHVDVNTATEHGVIVTHTPEAPAPGAVEHTFGFIFTLLSEFPSMFDQTAEGGWTEGQVTVSELYDRTLGIVGLGTIGSKVARIAHNIFNAEVIAYDPYVDGTKQSAIYPRTDREEMEASGVRLVDRETLFESASIVTMHVPLTPETEKMVSTSELEALEGGYLINLSRGGVVDEDALIDATQRDLLSGVALDVMTSEPPDPSHPLLGASNVYITPHIAGGKEGYTTRSARINGERMRTTLQDGVPDNVVNPAVLQ
jgi:D-3-phosphoglycerate dehydrogenase